MTRRCVTDEQHGQLRRRADEFVRRVDKGKFEVVVRNFPVWKTLVIGGKSNDNLLGEMVSKGHFVSDLAKDIMSKPKFITLAKTKTICLTRAKIGDLGFTEKPTIREIWTRIREVGGFCPAEVGPHLRLALEDQPNGDFFWVAMEQIFGSSGYPIIFYIGRDSGGARYLYGSYAATPNYRWDLSSEFVFVLRK